MDGLGLLGSERGGRGKWLAQIDRPAPGGLASHSGQWLTRVVLAGCPGGERKGQSDRPRLDAPPHRVDTRRFKRPEDKACRVATEIRVAPRPAEP